MSVTGTEDSEDGPPQRHTPRQVILDEVKERHTSHWDLDQLPYAELERELRAGRRERWSRRLTKGLVIVAGLLSLSILVTLSQRLLF